MPQPDPFRNFGILPQGLQPPPQTVRCCFSRGRRIGQYIGTGIVSSLGLGLAVLLALTMPFPLNLLGCAAALAGFGTFVYLATHNDYRWVELSENVLRAKHLYTGRVVERTLEEIDSLGTMVYLMQGRNEVAFMEALLGRIKGVEVRFRDRRTPLRILRADPAMTNAKELIEALIYRMGQIREVEAEVVNFQGQPLVRNIHWKGEKPAAPPGKMLKLCLCFLIFMALMFGPIFGFSGRQENRLHVLGSVPPREIALRTLIENGPGTNPHVTLTHFRCGELIVESNPRERPSIWVPLLPSESNDDPAEKQQEIKVVLRANKIGNESGLRQFLNRGRVTGLCSDTPGLTFGTLRTDLMKANPGMNLSSAWVVEELNGVPAASEVQELFLGAAVCFSIIIACAIVVLWMRS